MLCLLISLTLKLLSNTYERQKKIIIIFRFGCLLSKSSLTNDILLSLILQQSMIGKRSVIHRNNRSLHKNVLAFNGTPTMIQCNLYRNIFFYQTFFCHINTIHHIILSFSGIIASVQIIFNSFCRFLCISDTGKQSLHK